MSMPTGLGPPMSGAEDCMRGPFIRRCGASLTGAVGGGGGGAGFDVAAGVAPAPRAVNGTSPRVRFGEDACLLQQAVVVVEQPVALSTAFDGDGALFDLGGAAAQIGSGGCGQLRQYLLVGVDGGRVESFVIGRGFCFEDRDASECACVFGLGLKVGVLSLTVGGVGFEVVAFLFREQDLLFWHDGFPVVACCGDWDALDGIVWLHVDDGSSDVLVCGEGDVSVFGGGYVK